MSAPARVALFYWEQFESRLEAAGYLRRRAAALDDAGFIHSAALYRAAADILTEAS